MSFGEQLSSVRRRAGLTQEQFAEQLQVSRQAVSKWESGRGYPEIEKILYICNRYQVSIADMFAAEAPPPSCPAPSEPVSAPPHRSPSPPRRRSLCRGRACIPPFPRSSPICPRKTNGWPQACWWAWALSAD